MKKRFGLFALKTPYCRGRLSAAGAGRRSVNLLDLWRRHLSLTIAAVLIALAITVRMARRQLGSPSLYADGADLPEPAKNRWVRALVPGLTSLARGNGVAGFVAIFIAAMLLVLAFGKGLGYRPPVGFDPGPLASFAGMAALMLWLAARLALAFRGSRR